MLPGFLVEDGVRRENGQSPALEVSGAEALLLTLGIDRIIEQESLDVAIHGSKDGREWDPKPLLTFPQKFYCGVHSLLLDLSDRPDVRYVRAVWKMNRWGRGVPTPSFGFYLFADKVRLPELTAKAG